MMLQSFRKTPPKTVRWCLPPAFRDWQQVGQNRMAKGCPLAANRIPAQGKTNHIGRYAFYSGKPAEWSHFYLKPGKGLPACPVHRNNGYPNPAKDDGTQRAVDIGESGKDLIGLMEKIGHLFFQFFHLIL